MATPSFGALVPVAVAAAVAVGFLRTSFGGGIGLLLTPMLSLVFPARLVLALLAPMMNLSDPIALRFYWRRWDARQVRLLLPTIIVGVAVGAWTVSVLSEFWLRKAIGILALVFGGLQLVLTLRGRRLLSGRPHWATGLVAGGLAGSASTIAHSGGIVLSLYLVALPLEPAAIVGTANALLTVSNAFKLVSYWQIGLLTREVLLAAVLAGPALFAGAWLGYRVNRRLPRRAFELVIMTVALGGALRLLTAS